MLSILDIIEDTTVDGPGFRTSFMLPDVRTDARAVTIPNPGTSTGGIGCQQTKYWKKYLPTTLQM